MFKIVYDRTGKEIEINNIHAYSLLSYKELYDLGWVSKHMFEE